jgi:hypothetical protein
MRRDLKEEFLDSQDAWWSLTMIYFTYKEMVFAMACGDAEVKWLDDEDLPGDFFFRWIKPRSERDCDRFIDFDREIQNKRPEIKDKTEDCNFGSEKIDEDYIVCPNCNGTGEDGHDRCEPPNPYVCLICQGEKKIFKTFVENKAIEFEKQYGTELFLKLGTTALNKLLVEKGIITSKELIESFEEEIDKFKD